MTQQRPQPTSDRREYTAPAPLWRFGIAGWLILPFAIALGVVAISGYDLRGRLLELIYETFGIDAVMYAVTRPLASNSVALCSLWPAAIVSVFTATCVLVGVAIHPKRFGVWRACLLLVLSLLPTSCHLSTASWIYRLFGQSTWKMSSWSRIAYEIPIDFLLATTVVIPVFVLYRARAIAITIIALTLLATVLYADATNLNGTTALLPQPRAEALYIWLGRGFNLPVLAVAIWWGISARRKHSPPWACRSCCYDLRGTIGHVCPECGRPVGKVARGDEAEAAA